MLGNRLDMLKNKQDLLENIHVMLENRQDMFQIDRAGRVGKQTRHAGIQTGHVEKRNKLKKQNIKKKTEND